MKKIFSFVLLLCTVLVTAGCSNIEAVNLSESTLNHTLYYQNSSEQRKQYFFDEDTLFITAVDTIKPEMSDNKDYKEAISEEHKNIQVLETDQKFMITGDDNFKMELTKNEEGLLVNEEGEEFIKSN